MEKTYKKPPKATAGNTDEKNQATKKRSRKPATPRQIQATTETEGQLTIPKEQIISTNPDGSITITVPTQTQITLKLHTWAMSEKATESLKAIQMLIQQKNSKSKQKDTKNADQPPLSHMTTKVIFQDHSN